MINIELITIIDAKNAYERFIKDAKGFMWFDFSDKGELSNFSEVQKENEAYNSVFIGMRSVEISHIKGSVQKYKDFDKNFVPKNSIIEDRWCRIYMGYRNEDPLPPVQLYKIKDDYFVYDGNHRISVAKYLKFASIEAEVTEFIPSSGTKENVIYREKFIFEKTTGIQNVIFTETSQYSRMIKEISDYKDYLYKKERKKYDFIEASNIWNANIYEPAVKIIMENNLLENFKDRTISDLFIYFLDHKYYESEKKGENIGFSYALIDFINHSKTIEDDSIDNKIELNPAVMENLKLLQEVDKKRYLDYAIIRKNEILKEVTNIEFNHNFIILFEIDEYISDNNIKDFREGIKSWYDNIFCSRVDEFRKKVVYLPDHFNKKGQIFLENKEKLFFSIQNYNMFYSKRVDWVTNYSEIVANYIVEIFIPLIDILDKKEVGEKDYIEIYYDIQNKYNYLSEFKKDLRIYDAAESFFKEDNRKYQKIHDWFLLKFKDSSKSEMLIDYVLGRFEEKQKDKSLFRKTIEKYGKPKKYSTVFKLENVKDLYEETHENGDWIKDKFIPELEKMLESKDIVTFFKTKSTLESIKGEIIEMSIIDFYADVMAYGEFLDKNINDVDIIDLVLGYKMK